MKKPKLTRLQKELLGRLCLDSWDTPPLRTRAQTVLSLQERGLIKLRMPPRIIFGRWSECECQLTDEGHSQYTDLVHWEMSRSARSMAGQRRS